MISFSFEWIKLVNIINFQFNRNEKDVMHLTGRIL